MVSRNRFLSLLVIFVVLFMAGSCRPQEARVNQKKIEKERTRNHNQAVKEYNQAVKRHNKIQSKSTKVSMKKTKKESEKLRPGKH